MKRLLILLKPFVVIATMLERDLYQCNGDFEITVICALQVKRHAVEAFLDVKYETDGFLTRKSSWCAELGCDDMLLIRRTHGNVQSPSCTP